MKFIDHSLAFRTTEKRPKQYKKVDLEVSDLLRERLMRLNEADLKAQIAACEKGVQEVRRMIGHFGLVVCLWLSIGFLFLAVVYTFLIGTGEDPSPTKAILTILIPGLVGYYLPKYWVTKRQQARQEEITNGFPDSLDMMLVCVEAGQSLDQAIVRVGKELRASYPELAEEFEIVAYEMKAGKEKDKVLRDMGTRCGVQDVASFVTGMIQSAAFGTSIADALRVYAGEMRDKRVMRAEEAANKLPTKMTLATMTLTVPPLLIILVGPSVHGITQLGNMGN